MRYVWTALLLLIWGLWLGGLIALFLSLQVLFREDRALAAQVGPRLFPVFERYQLILSLAALIATIGMRVASRSQIWLLVFAILAAATVPAMTSMAWLTPRMVTLWKQNLSGGEDFRKLHGYSMILYLTTTLLLLLGGLVITAALGRAKKQA